MEMRVYIANLGKYNEGELVGAWFAPPISFTEVAEKIGLNSEYEEYAIHDYELPFEVGEFCSIDEVNRLCVAAELIDDRLLFDNMQTVISHFGFSGVEDLSDHMDDIIVHSCDSLENLAMEYVDEGLFGEIPSSLVGYIDYAAIARDMEIEGMYLSLSGGIVEWRQ